MFKKLLITLSFMFSVIAYGQVTLFSAPEYQGLSVKINDGSINRMSQTIIGNDRLGSMLVPKGYKVTLYEHDNFNGYAETFDHSILNLPTRLMGQVSSLIVTRDNGSGWISGGGNAQPGWNDNNVIIYSECYYGGNSNKMLPANYPTMPGNFHRMLSSIRIPAGYEVDLFTQVNYGGNVVRLRADQPCAPPQWNNAVASMKIYKNNSTYFPPENYDPWTQSNYPVNSNVTLYNSCNYRGQNLPLSDGKYGKLPFGFVNNIYSIKIPAGKQAMLYSGPNFTGAYMQLSGDRDCMIANNEFIVGSIKISPFNNNANTNPGWNGAPPRPTPANIVQEEVQVYNDCNYQGRNIMYKPGSYPFLLTAFSKSISSVKVPVNRRVILYTGINFTGHSYILTNSNSCLELGYNDKIRSVIVEAY